MPIRRKPNARSRARQAEAARYYLQGHTYEQTAKHCSYANESCARAAVRRWLARQDQAAGDERRIAAARLESIVSSYIGDALAGDAEAARVALSGIRDKARLLGVNREQGGGNSVSAGDLAAQFVQVVQVLPDAARLVRSLPDEVLAAIPEETRAQLFPAEEPVQHRSAAEDGWANVCAEDVGGPHRAAPFGRDDENEGCAPFCGPMTAEWVQPPSGEGVRPPAGDTAAGVTDSGDPDNGSEPITEVVAELIPLPPAQRRVKAPVDGNGVPYDRGGIHRRLPGPSSRYYNPLGYSGWTQIIRPTDE